MASRNESVRKKRLSDIEKAYLVLLPSTLCKGVVVTLVTTLVTMLNKWSEADVFRNDRNSEWRDYIISVWSGNNSGYSS